MECGKIIKMDFENGESMYMNAKYITAYAYSKEKDKTVVAMIGEGQPLYFPGDQTEKISMAFHDGYWRKLE